MSKQTKHWEGCWRDPKHHGCAVALIERMRADELEHEQMECDHQDNYLHHQIIGANRLAECCARAIRAGDIDSRSAIGDALLDYMEVGHVGGPRDVSEWLDAHARPAPPAEGD